VAECLFCKTSEKKVVFREFGIDYLRCRNCGHLFSSFERDADYDGYFESIENEVEAIEYWNISHNKMYDAFAKKYMIGRKGRILDVGAGLGFFVKFAGEIKGWESFGVEISKGGYNFGKEKLKLKNFFCGKLEKTNFEDNSFDIITMWDVVEHLSKPHSILQKSINLLKDGGFLFLHTPNGEVQLLKSKIKKLFFGEKEGKHYLEARDHLNLYKKSTITRLLKESGFETIEFVHLPPIQSVAGKSDYIKVLAKNLWWRTSQVLYFLTFKKMNIDNLFVLAKKIS